MKRSYSLMTPAQAGYPEQWAAAKRRRANSKFVRGRAALTGAQLAAVDREIIRVTTARSDKNSTTTSIAATAVTNNGLCYDVCSDLTHGDNSVDQFQGEGITPVGLTVRYNFSMTNTSTAEVEQVRILIVQFFGQGELAAAGGANFVLANTGGTRAALSVKDWINRKQFKVLYDSDAIQLQNQPGGGGGNGSAICGKAYIPGKRLRKLIFDNAATPNPIKNNISVIAISDSSAVTPPTFEMVTQLVFTDNS